MTSFLQSLNIFPYKELWRVKNQTTVGHKSTGIASILALILLLIIAVIKLVQVFQMNTVYVSTQTDISLVPPANILSTFQNETEHQPFMFAFKVLTNSFIFNNQITAQYIVNDKVQNKHTRQKITLQKCTPQHFSKVPNIRQIYDYDINDTWTCLPLNQMYEISGNQNIGSIFKYIVLQISCNSSNCKNSTKENYIIQTYTLNSFVNPYNSTYPKSLYFSRKHAVFQSSTQAMYFLDLDQHIVNTDRSLLPFKSIEKKTCIQVSETVQAFVIAADIPYTQIFLKSSGKVSTHKRTFLKLMDAIAYIGGIFPAILAAFFFMESFGKLVYQMKVASYYFKERQAQKFGFVSFVKQNVYNILSGLNFKPDWRVQKKRERIKEIVNNMLDIVYLQRRIEFLQRGISILLERHQLKGLLLSFKPTLQFCEEKFKQFQFRHKFMSYLAEQLQSQKGQFQRQNKCTKKLLNINTITQRDIVSESINHIHPPQQHKKVLQNDDKKANQVQNQRKQIQPAANIQQKSESQDVGQAFQKGNLLIDQITLDLAKLFRQATTLYENKISKKIVENLDSQTKAKLMQFIGKKIEQRASFSIFLYVLMIKINKQLSYFQLSSSIFQYFLTKDTDENR